MNTTDFCIIVSGPTGVGKTAFVDHLAQELPIEIINGDMGQLYTPLTIGTAKPDWQHASTPHHLFDVINKPELFTVVAFRQQIATLCREIWQRNKIPVIVGGSGYYLTALFFPPAEHEKIVQKHTYDSHENIWQKLYTIDPVRAQEIDPGDRYRIERALDIWYSTGERPSSYVPVYDPIFTKFIFVWLIRDRHDLYDRINFRTEEMLQSGWVDEVKKLIGTLWQNFLESKKIIGYSEVIAYCQGSVSKKEMIEAIQQKTRNYAKRQMTFMRMLSKKLAGKGATIECNLTHQSVHSYSNHLVHIAKKIVGQ